MAEKKPTAGLASDARVERRVTPQDRIYEASADYDALLREYHKVLTTAGHHDKPAELMRATLGVEIAEDLSASILAFRKATASAPSEANVLSRRVCWLNWILVLVGVAGIGAAWWFWAHPHP